MTDRIPALDGLRALAISLVVASHFTKAPFIPAGFGVSIFFAISGFIITTLLLKEIDRSGAIDLWAFYKRRLFRLMPESPRVRTRQTGLFSEISS